MKTLIVGSGSLSDTNLLIKNYSRADLVIAADGGLIYLDKAGLSPHILLGDFDSLPISALEKAKRNENIEIIAFPSEKDYTDMEIAIDLAIEKGASEIVLIGATGTRLDHTTANIHLLYKILKSGVKGCIEDSNNQIYLIDDTITLKKQDSCKVSLLPLPPSVKGLSTKGLSYPLKDADMVFGLGLGISNEFCDDTAVVSIREGLLLVFVSKD